MKKLFIILAIFLTVQSFGQVPTGFTRFYSKNAYTGVWNIESGNIVFKDTSTAPIAIGEFRYQLSDSTAYVGLSTTGKKWYKLRGDIPAGVGTGTVTLVGASIGGSVISVSGSPIANAGTLAFSWNGAGTDVVLGNGAYTPYTTLITGITNPLYSPIGHSHISSDISDFTTAARASFSAGTGITITDGVIAWNGSASGISSFNGLTGSTQTLAIDTTYNGAVSWNSTGTSHTLRLPARLFNGYYASQSALDDTAAAIRGTTPTLQQVTNAGNSTTNSIASTNSIYADVVVGVRQSASQRAILSKDGNTTGQLMLDNGTNPGHTTTLKPQSATSSSQTIYFPFTGNASDTLATLADVRSGGGGSMVYPGAGIPVSTGSGWGISISDNSTNWNTAYADRMKWDGGSTGLVAATGRTSLGLTGWAQNLVTTANPSAVRYIKINADNTVALEDASAFLNNLNAGLAVDSTTILVKDGGSNRDTLLVNTNYIATRDWVYDKLDSLAASKEAAFTETTQEFTGSTSMSITLSNTPKSGKAEMYYLNGIVIKASNISRTGTSVTLSGFTRESSDVITAKYSY